MIEYRKFRLINSKKEIYELTDQKVKHFLYQPFGLGFRGSVLGYRFKNRYRYKDTEFDLPNLSGTMIFHDDLMQNNYALYKEFMDFIQFRPLEIEYLTAQLDNWNEAKYAECEVVQLDKSEADEYGLIRCPIYIQCFTFWRNRTPNVYTAKPGMEDEQLQIPMTFPFHFGKDGLKGIPIETNGTTECPLTIEIIGNCTNPSYKIFDENGEEYGSGAFIGTFARVKVESDTEKITLIKGGVEITNPAKFEDLTVGNLNDDKYFVTFLNVRPGKNTMSVSAGSTFAGTVRFTWRDEFVSF